VTVTNESGAKLPFYSFPDPAGRLGDGNAAQRVSIIGKFAPCPNTSAGKDFSTKGASYETCSLALANAGTQVTSAQSTGQRVEGGPDCNREPVVWS